jgi:hypothetical protein
MDGRSVTCTVLFSSFFFLFDFLLFITWSITSQAAIVDLNLFDFSGLMFTQT